MNEKILVVDDDEDIRQAVAIYLKQENYQVLEAADGIEALDILGNQSVHLIILDVMMPNLDGIVTAYRIREKANVPILMLSAKGEDVDKVYGLQVGADDYLTKPFNPMELLARVKSMLRRYMTLGEFQKGPESLIEVGGLQLDTASKEVIVDGRKVHLTKTEFNILELLMVNKGKVFSVDNIYESVWKEPSFNADNTVSVHIRKIREKIELDPKSPNYLKVVWGVGYKVEE
ncbi:response regulator transcription factor [Vagococcus vulneris]|uniref:DNA-binding response regulator n=1 Tax=Vagococcus vulneris TaxID=1977869 RepID=A0A429ZYT5_9ENTE|nr:response regulator transcription factor [Vagococcus vulneris]RST99118.1 DNA-binding response regulator [Vagococcus vulneris]